MAKKVVVTGTAGKAAPYTAQCFLDQGWDVLSVDIKTPQNPLCRHLNADLTRLGECYEILSGADAVVHLAAVPRMGIVSPQVTFENNVLSTYNILEAASGLGIKKAVIASSESSYGIVFSEKDLKPRYLPLDEDHPQLPEDSYGLSKVVCEEIGHSFNRRTGIQVAAFRIGNVIVPEQYQDFPGWIRDSSKRKKILWSYIDARDLALACVLAVEAEGLGSTALNIAEDITSMDIKSVDLIKAQYPDVTDIRGPVDQYQTLYSNAKAKKLLGWQPVHQWRNYVKV